MINVKYFGRSDIPAFEETFNTVEDMMKIGPFKPFGQKNQFGPEGKGFQLEKSNHATQKKLKWDRSGHTGDANAVAGFDENGQAVYVSVDEFGLNADALAENELIQQLVQDIAELKSQVLFLETTIGAMGGVKDVQYDESSREFRKFWVNPNLDPDGYEVVFTAVDRCAP